MKHAPKKLSVERASFATVRRANRQAKCFRLAGQNADYIAKQLDNFKSGKRKSGAMNDMAANLTADVKWAALRRFFAKQPAYCRTSQRCTLASVVAYLYART